MLVVCGVYYDLLGLALYDLAGDAATEPGNSALEGTDTGIVAKGASHNWPDRWIDGELIWE